jgi:hypothetical protein
LPQVTLQQLRPVVSYLWATFLCFRPLRCMTPAQLRLQERAKLGISGGQG